MTLTLDLPPEIEARLRDHAAVEGVDPSALVARVLGQNLLPNARAGEDDVLRRINLGFSAEFWGRFHQLTDRLEAGELTPSERDEFLVMADQVEEANNNRLAAVIELAAIRGKTFDETLDALGLRPKKARRE